MSGSSVLFTDSFYVWLDFGKLDSQIWLLISTVVIVVVVPAQFENQVSVQLFADEGYHTKNCTF